MDCVYILEYTVGTSRVKQNVSVHKSLETALKAKEEAELVEPPKGRKKQFYTVSCYIVQP